MRMSLAMLVSLALLSSCGNKGGAVMQVGGGGTSAPVSSGGTATPTPSSDATSNSGPMDGTWKMVDLTCNGQALPTAAKSYFEAPNSFTYQFQGSTGTTVAVTKSGTCTITTPFSVSYTSDTMTTAATAVPSCNPAGCDSVCSATLSGQSVTYKFQITGTSARVDTTAPSLCSKYGYSDPAEASLSKQ